MTTRPAPSLQPLVGSVAYSLQKPVPTNPSCNEYRSAGKPDPQTNCQRSTTQHGTSHQKVTGATFLRMQTSACSRQASGPGVAESNMDSSVQHSMHNTHSRSHKRPRIIQPQSANAYQGRAQTHTVQTVQPAPWNQTAAQPHGCIGCAHPAAAHSHCPGGEQHMQASSSRPMTTTPTGKAPRHAA